MYSPFVHPDKVIARGSAILSTLLVASLISTFATVDAAMRSGEVTEYVINPTRQAYQSFVSEIERQIAEDEAEEARAVVRRKFAEDPASSSATVRTEINITTNGETTTTTEQPSVRTQQQAPAQTGIQSGGDSTGTTQSYEDWLKEVEARRAQSQAEYDARVQQMNEDYEARVQQNKEDSQKRYEEAVAKQKAEFEAKKAEMGL